MKGLPVLEDGGTYVPPEAPLEIKSTVGSNHCYAQNTFDDPDYDEEEESRFAEFRKEGRHTEKTLTVTLPA